MIVAGDVLTGVLTGYQAVFDTIMQGAMTAWSKVATEVPADDKETINFWWLGQAPRMKPFKGTYDTGESFPHDYSVKVTPRGIIVEINIDMVRRNPLSQATLHVADLSEQAALYYDEQVFGQLSLGFTANGFDGVTFYNASHVFGRSATFDNLDTAALAEDGVVYNTAYAALMSAQGDNGGSLGNVPSHIVVKPLTRKTALRLFNAETISTGGSNVFKGDVEPVVVPWLTGADADEWHLLCANKTLKPIMLVVDIPPTFVPQDSPQADSVFEKRVARFKIECIIATAFGDPRLAYGSNGTT